jgi:PAS domain S-box-containing protein
MANAPSVAGRDGRLLNLFPSAYVRGSLVLGVYIAGAPVLEVATRLLLPDSGVSPWVPSAGWHFAFLLYFGWRLIPVYAITDVLCRALIWGDPSLAFLEALDKAAWFSFSPVVLYSAATIYLRWQLRISTDLRRLADVVPFLAAAVVVPGIAGFLYANVESLLLMGGLTTRFSATVLNFWLGNAVGILSVSPILLSQMLPKLAGTSGASTPSPRLQVDQALEWTGWCMLLAGSVYIAMGPEGPSENRYLYFVFLPLIAIALRYEFFGSAVGVLVASAMAGSVGFGEQAGIELLDIELFLFALSLTGLVLGAVSKERTQSLRQARETEELYRLAITAADAVPYAREYASETYTFVGEGIYELTGFKPDEFTPEVWSRISREAVLHGEAAGLEEREAIDRTRRGEIKQWRSEGLVLTKDGRERWVADSSVEIPDAAGRAVRSIGILQDLTERRRAEEALLQSETRTRQIVDTALDAVITIDREGIVTGWNARAETIFGWSRADALGSRLSALVIPEELRGAHETGIKHYLETGEGPLLGRRVEMTAQRRGGEKFPVELSITTLTGPDGSINFSAFIRDITERKRAEEALRKSEEALDLALHGAELGLWNWNIQTGEVKYDERWAAVLGFTSAEIEPNLKGWERLVHPDDRERVVRAMKDHIKGASSFFEAQYRLRAKDGTWRWVLERGRVVERDAGGKAVRAAGTLLDVTPRVHAEEERQRLEAQMLHAQKLESLGVLAGGIAHDFNNLLAGILGNADLALLDLPPDSPGQEYIESIVAGAQRAAELCKQMLAYSGRGHFVVEPINLNHVVEEMTHLLGVSVSKKASLRFDFSQELAPIAADATQIRQVVMNLITNASESLGEQGGAIVVSTGVEECDADYLRDNYLGDNLPAGTYVFLEVSDTGCGMDAPTQARIFDPFYTTKFAGRGLGLAAVLGIVRGHRGGIKVYSEPGQGSTFRLLFPASTAQVPPPPLEPAAEPVHAEGGAVLLIDDEAAVRSTARTMLERAGFTPFVAESGPEGVDLLRKYADQIGLVILDMTMPQMSGEETFRELRAVNPDVRVILSSGYTEQDAMERFHESGLAGFIQKPYRSKELQRRIREVLQAQ